MTSEWMKWEDFGESETWSPDEVVNKGSYTVHTQHAKRREGLPKPASIEESIRKAKESHKKLFEESRATCGFAPTAVVIDPEGLWTAVCCPDWADMREDGRRELHRVALQERAVALVWGSDSYYLEGDVGDIKNMEDPWSELPQPSKSPNRKEAFVLTTIWPDGSAEMEMYPYKIVDKKLVWLEGERVPTPDSKCEQRICPAWAPSTGVIQ